MTVFTAIGLSALHHTHIALNAHMAERFGWQQPTYYTSADKEAETVRSAVGISDIGPLGKVLLHGEIDRYLLNGLKQEGATEVGNVALMRFTEDSGIGDILMARLAHDEAILITEPNQAQAVAGIMADAGEICAHAVDITSVMIGIRLIGPSAPRILGSVTELNTYPRYFVNMSCTQGNISQIHGTLIRYDLADLPSYDIYVDRSYGKYIWETLIEAGHRFKIVPVGMDSLSILKRSM